MKTDLQLSSLRSAYATGTTPEQVIADVHRRIADSPAEIWISRLPLEQALVQCRLASERREGGVELPLYGVPFAVKDNIDVAGLPTTAACPGFARTPAESAPVVSRLLEAGAIVVGKTNLDQFATGLVGTRSPYGACRNAFSNEHISGGSSSGSALAVALGLSSFALGTDTAGSGRVPAALNNVVGYKPSLGLLSTRGVVPACASLDCVSIFAASAGDAALVGGLCAGYDPADPYSRSVSSTSSDRTEFRFGTPRDADLEFYGDRQAEQAYLAALSTLARVGGTRVEIDFAPFRAAGALLYAGPWLAERLSSVEEFLDRNPDQLLPVTRQILERGRGVTGSATFRGQKQLRAYVQQARPTWQMCEVLALPTAPTVYTVAQIENDPLELNSRLGLYTTFVNLMDLSAVAVPAGFRADGLPFGLSLIGRAGTDLELLSIAARFHDSLQLPVGATGDRLWALPIAPSRDGRMLLAVAGAHLSGQPLNHQLTSRGGKLVKTCRTTADYRLYALDTSPPKPGLVREPGFQGPGIELEVWSLDAPSFGAFVDEVPAPLAIGMLALDDGSSVNGFVCEPHALAQATEITEYGGWRRYRDRSR